MAHSGELRRYLLPIKPKYLLVLLETCRRQTEEDRKRTNFSQPESSSNFGSGSKSHVALYTHQDGADLRQPRNRGVELLRCGCTTAHESWLGSFLPRDALPCMGVPASSVLSSSSPFFSLKTSHAICQHAGSHPQMVRSCGQQHLSFCTLQFANTKQKRLHTAEENT